MICYCIVLCLTFTLLSLCPVVSVLPKRQGIRDTTMVNVHFDQNRNKHGSERSNTNRTGVNQGCSLTELPRLWGSLMLQNHSRGTFSEKLTSVFVSQPNIRKFHWSELLEQCLSARRDKDFFSLPTSQDCAAASCSIALTVAAGEREKHIITSILQLLHHTSQSNNLSQHVPVCREVVTVQMTSAPATHNTKFSTSTTTRTCTMAPSPPAAWCPPCPCEVLPMAEGLPVFLRL